MFKRRSCEKELLDEPDIDKGLLYQNLNELEIINKYPGGHNISIQGLNKIVKGQTKKYNLIDIGCGGGDSLKAIAGWLKYSGQAVHLTGIDLKPDCIEYAQKNCRKHPDITFICDDFRNVFSKDVKVDIVHAALFCHHFAETEIIDFISLCNKNKAIVIINDLERNPIAYYSIRFLTKLFSKSPFVKNDAPISVLRGFKKREWSSIIQKAGIRKFTIKNRWAFRHLIIAYPNE